MTGLGSLCTLKCLKRDKNWVHFVSSLRCAHEIDKEKKNQQKKEKDKGICGHIRYIYSTIIGGSFFDIG